MQEANKAEEAIALMERITPFVEYLRVHGLYAPSLAYVSRQLTAAQYPSLIPILGEDAVLELLQTQNEYLENLPPASKLVAPQFRFWAWMVRDFFEKWETDRRT